MTREITHHLTDALLMGYAAGALPEAFDLVIATHLSLCDACRARAAGFEMLGGAVLDEAAGPVAPLADDSLEATLARIAEGPAAPAAAARRDPVLPVPLAEYVGGGVEAIRWRRVGMGVRQAILPTSREARARLLYIPAGAAMPDHGHTGTEITLVLQGAFQDDDGYYARGDVEVATEEVDHTPVADFGEDCICLAVTDAPLRFNALLPRLAQPFLRI
ncbi:ChrR family anti-sigma-E factor [Poseidonocella sedimentorum]|nr:ChrR family anti-sigma-E factor [Poseidonocella sedimentorum]